MQRSPRSVGAIIIPAAGRGSRFGVWTGEYLPKPLIPLADGRSFLVHLLDHLAPTELPIYVVTHYREDQIALAIESRFPNLDIHLVHQSGEIGTAADGLLAVEPLVNQDFVVAQPDHYFAANPFPDLIQGHKEDHVTFVVETEKFGSLGYGDTCSFDAATGQAYPYEDRDGLREVVLVDGAMALPKDFFHQIRETKKDLDPAVVDIKQVLIRMSGQTDVKMRAVRSRGFYANVNDDATHKQLINRMVEMAKRRATTTK
jgi:NDP-sugar pyrophosphorylase family protein